ncbi:hypothetical protein EUAN_23560 [Andreesenia angusta]|uniref:DUF2281 domain-containing protein n=1 Tax=Andreesenia angusta TaxID=39480 RepID=A0A1S1V4C0_9FIRM|nr:hypothetical protein [Andreesenia angusta]OHW61275.1 hypothetical protein EUAN_23560 [Andreesenia angusta]
MNTAKDTLLKLMEVLSEDDLAEVVDFAEYLNIKKNRNKTNWDAVSKDMIEVNMEAYKELAK